MVTLLLNIVLATCYVPSNNYCIVTFINIKTPCLYSPLLPVTPCSPHPTLFWTSVAVHTMSATQSELLITSEQNV